MSLGDELRAALNLEADMQLTAGPDVERLIVGGRTRKRRRTVSRVGGVALAVVLVGGGVYAVTQGGPSDTGSTRIANESTATSEPSDAGSDAGAPPVLAGNQGGSNLEPGTYRIRVGSDAAGGPIDADLTIEGPGWWSANFPFLLDGQSSGGFGAYRPYALSAGSGCMGDAVNGDVAQRPRPLARQLARLPRTTMLQPITSSELLGRPALHLRLRVPQDCWQDEAFYLIAETPRGSRGVTYGRAADTTVVIDFWVFDLDGVPVVVDAWHGEDASAGLVGRVAQAVDSITFVPGT